MVNINSESKIPQSPQKWVLIASGTLTLVAFVYLFGRQIFSDDKALASRSMQQTTAKRHAPADQHAADRSQIRLSAYSPRDWSLLGLRN